MKEIIKITIGLTLTCMIAAFIMGGVFAITAKAKKHNAYLNFQETMFSMLGYEKDQTPTDLELLSVYRYIITTDQGQSIGYVVPLKQGYAFIMIDLQGRFIAQHQLDLDQVRVREEQDRAAVIDKALNHPLKIIYADRFIVARQNGQRSAYLLPGKTPGFKTFIHFMVSMSPDYKIAALEIIEHQEDPGLGAEITEKYFKHQFIGKQIEQIRSLKVIKEPLPDEYRVYLNNLTPENQTAKYVGEDIYAISGATISSVAVANGVQNAMKKFAYRLKVLNAVIATQKIVVGF